MNVSFHSHVLERMVERGTNKAEITKAVETGERFTAKFGRTGFRLTMDADGVWRGKAYAHKRLEVYAVEEAGSWFVITAVVKYF